jgi:hypothetical protein
MKRYGIHIMLVLVALSAVAAMAPVSGWAQDKLPLAERRAVKAFQEQKLPAVQKAINAAAGFTVPLDIDWDAIAIVGQAEYYMNDEYWVWTIFQPLAVALKQIASDDMGKKALKAGLKKVIITYDEKTAPATNWPNGLNFDKGTLRINFRPWSNSDDENGPNFKERVAAIVKTVETKL